MALQVYLERNPKSRLTNRIDKWQHKNQNRMIDKSKIHFLFRHLCWILTVDCTLHNFALLQWRVVDGAAQCNLITIAVADRQTV